MSENPVNLKGLETIYSFSKKNKQSIPPVEKWDPPFCGEIDMKILRNGKWFYMGSEIKRPAMVKLFSSILRLDKDKCYYLVTPVEKVRIKVEDVPFVAISINKININGKIGYTFKTNLNEEILLSRENPLTIKIAKNSEPSPYVLLRKNLNALLSRSVFYELVDFAEEKIINNKKFLVIESMGETFKIHEVDK